MNLHVDHKKYLIDQIEILRTFTDDFVAKFLITYAEQLAVVTKVPFYEKINNNTIEMLSQSQINLIKSMKG